MMRTARGGICHVFAFLASDPVPTCFPAVRCAQGRHRLHDLADHWSHGLDTSL